MKNTKLILTFFTLWLSVFFTDILEDFVAYFFILSLGILHGANDLGVGEKTLKQHPILSKKWVMLLFYVLSIFVVAFLLMQFPSVTLALFVLLSAYHFGEQHWESYISNDGYVSKLFMMSYGMVVFFLLFNAHSTLVSEIIADISGFWINASVIESAYCICFWQRSLYCYICTEVLLKV